MNIFALIMTTLLGLSFSALAEPITRQLERDGTLFRLNGDFKGADEIQEQLLKIKSDPVGHVYALNTIVTHMTWDETQRGFDEALHHHADQTLNWCHNETNLKQETVRAHFYCGQAHFALSYFHGLQGNYYQAGQHGTESIEHLESALEIAPNLTDAKMHLGVAYYIADNLPPYIKMFSRLLWFIPTGNSKKSLPYLRAVINQGDQFVDVARYSYVNLLLANPAYYDEAVQELRTLTKRYPTNKRFHLRLISALVIQGAYDSALAAIDTYLAQFPAAEELDLSLAKIWQVRAHLGLNQAEPALRIFREVDPVVTAASDKLPTWSIAWHQLNRGQIFDLANRRADAKRTYKYILSSAKTSYVNDVIQEAARAGLANPFRLANY
ncbi:MAG: tetratricopeptide (TPR) repeat protein [Candidatus Azotimanducaceae bacterium]|jgi:tetratricopeptide (TPR) repeat protein